MISSVHGTAWYVCLPILPWKPGPVHNSFNTGGFKPRGQPWITFLVSNCVFLPFTSVPYPCWFRLPCSLLENYCPKINISSFSFLECGDTSRNDLELESVWKRLPRALTMQGNVSGRVMDAGNHELLVWKQTLQHIHIWTSSLKVYFQAWGHSFSTYGRL